jgi:hypothetical protein
VARRGRDGQPDLCPTCYQAPVADCAVCGQRAPCRRTTPDRSPICFRCQLERRLGQLLAGPDGHIPAALVPVRDAIVSVDNPVTGIGWLHRSPAAALLARIAHGELALSHQTLDDAPRGHGVEHLRQLLIWAGALPARDPYLARLERFINQHTATLADDHDRGLVRAWATWRLLRRLRDQAAQDAPIATAPSVPGGGCARSSASWPGWTSTARPWPLASRPMSTGGWPARPTPAPWSARSWPGRRNGRH